MTPKACSERETKSRGERQCHKEQSHKEKGNEKGRDRNLQQDQQENQQPQRRLSTSTGINTEESSIRDNKNSDAGRAIVEEQFVIKNLDTGEQFNMLEENVKLTSLLGDLSIKNQQYGLVRLALRLALNIDCKQLGQCATSLRYQGDAQPAAY